MKRTAASIAALLLASCGGPLLYAEIEIPDLRVTLPSESFPAFSAAIPANWCDPSATTPPSPPCVALDTSYDIGAQVPAFTQKGVTTELRLRSVALTLSATQSAGGPVDLGGIQSATILVGADPAVPGSGTVVATYTRTTVSPPPTTLAVSGDANLDLSPYLASGKLPVRVQVVIDSGTPAFQADILAGFYVKVTLDWGRYL
jgi:hypothetical protein